MKRSEMLDLINDFYQECFNEYAPGFCEDILDILEEKGMLPPFDHDIYMKTWRDGGSGHVWEKE